MLYDLQSVMCMEGVVGEVNPQSASQEDENVRWVLFLELEGGTGGHPLGGTEVYQCSAPRTHKIR